MKRAVRCLESTGGTDSVRRLDSWGAEGESDVKKDIWDRQQFYGYHGKTGGSGALECSVASVSAAGGYLCRIDFRPLLYNDEMYPEGAGHDREGIFRLPEIQLEDGNRHQSLLFYAGGAHGAEYPGGGADGSRFGGLCVLPGGIPVGGSFVCLFEHLSVSGVFQI